MCLSNNSFYEHLIFRQKNEMMITFQANEIVKTNLYVPSGIFLESMVGCICNPEPV